jgi:CRP/FNR family cyclic AMP-dependent transcriptional regulator
MQRGRLELLEAMPIFGGLTEESLTFLLEISRIVSVSEGQFFFREADEASSMFVLEEGRVAILKKWEDKDHLLGYLGKGDCFGEVALLDLCPRSASVLAVGDCNAIELSTAAFHELYSKSLAQFTLIQMNMGREVSRRLRRADERLFEKLVTAHSLDESYLCAAI